MGTPRPQPRSSENRLNHFTCGIQRDVHNFFFHSRVFMKWKNFKRKQHFSTLDFALNHRAYTRYTRTVHLFFQSIKTERVFVGRKLVHDRMEWQSCWNVTFHWEAKPSAAATSLIFVARKMLRRFEEYEIDWCYSFHFLQNVDTLYITFPPSWQSTGDDCHDPSDQRQEETAYLQRRAHHDDEMVLKVWKTENLQPLFSESTQKI